MIDMCWPDNGRSTCAVQPLTYVASGVLYTLPAMPLSAARQPITATALVVISHSSGSARAGGPHTVGRPPRHPPRMRAKPRLRRLSAREAQVCQPSACPRARQRQREAAPPPTTVAPRPAMTRR